MACFEELSFLGNCNVLQSESLVVMILDGEDALQIFKSFSINKGFGEAWCRLLEFSLPILHSFSPR